MKPDQTVAAALLAVLLAAAVSACVIDPAAEGPSGGPSQSQRIVSGVPVQPPTLAPLKPATPGPGPTMTPYFANYWGNATLDGAPVPVGAVVEAFNPRGEMVGRFVVNTAGYYGYMRAYGEDATSTPAIPGMRDGETILFKISGRAATTGSAPAVWHSDPAPAQIDLKAASAPTATPATPSGSPPAAATTTTVPTAGSVASSVAHPTSVLGPPRR